MAFPNNPNPGDTYTDEYGTVWVYAGPINGWYRQTVIPVNDTTYIGSDGAPGGIGNNTEVVFNDNGSLASDSGLTYNKTTDALSGGAFVPTGSTVPSNGVYRPSANNVAISTNGSGRLFVDSSGNVAVGTSTFQGAKLQVSEASSGASASVNSDTLFLENNGQAGITIGTPNNTIGQIRFADPQNDTAGRIAYEHYNDAMAFTVNNAERLRITSDGKVGIGTTSPGANLEIGTASGSNTSIRLNSSTSDYLELSSEGTAAYIVAGHPTTGGANLGFKTTGSSSTDVRMYITSGGEVGIGTTSPTQKLQVTDGALSNFYIAPGYNGGTGTTIGVGGGEYLAFNGAPFTTERMRIDSSGRLLVGTSTSRSSRVYRPSGDSPLGAPLQIEGTSVGGALQIVNNFAGDAGASIVLGKSRGSAVGSITAVASGDQLGNIQFNGVDVTTTGDLESCAASIQAFVDGTPGANDMPGRLVFSTTADGDSSPTERLRIDSSGNVGIGTTVANSKLSIGNGASVNDGLTITFTGDSSTLARFYADTSTGEVSIGGIGGSYFPTFYSAGSEKARIDTSGRLLVGTSSTLSDSALLQVNGFITHKPVIGHAHGQGAPSTTAVTNSITGLFMAASAKGSWTRASASSGTQHVSFKNGSNNDYIEWDLLLNNCSSITCSLIYVNAADSTSRTISSEYSLDGGATYAALGSATVGGTGGAEFGGTISAINGSCNYLKIRAFFASGATSSNLIGIRSVRFTPTCTSVQWANSLNSV